MKKAGRAARDRAPVVIASAAAAWLVVAWLSPTPAAPTQAPSADANAPAAALEILRSHAAAVGSPEAIAATKTLRLAGRVRAFGLAGTIETLVAGPGDYIQRIDLGPVAQTMALAGGADAWGVDANKMVRSLEGDERAAIVSEAWFTSFAYLAPPAAASPGAPAQSVAPLAPAGDTLRLEITPPGGKPRLLAFDPATRRLVRAVEIQDVDTITAYFEDFREVDGLLLPFRTRQTTGDPTHDVVVELESIERNVPIDPARFRRAVAESGPTFASGDHADGVPIEVWSQHLFAEVRVNGRGPFRFFLDTGAGASCLDDRVARELGLARVGTVEARGVTGTADVSFVLADSLAIGPVTLRAQNLVALPLSDLPGGRDRRFDGILGYSFFSRFVVRIDYEDSTISLWDPGAFSPPAGAVPVPISLEGNVPSAEGVVNGRFSGSFRVDTGSNATLDLHGPFVAEHGFLDAAARVAHRPFAGIGGIDVGTVTRLESFSIGPYAVREPIAGLSRGGEGAFASRLTAGNVGSGFLRRFTVTFDYAGRRMFLEPNARLGERDVFDRSGLSLLSSAGVRKVVHVEEGSPAWRAGIRAGDVVLAVNGRGSSDWGDDEIARALRAEPGTWVSVRLRKDGGIRSVRFRLQEIL